MSSQGGMERLPKVIPASLSKKKLAISLINELYNVTVMEEILTPDKTYC